MCLYLLSIVYFDCIYEMYSLLLMLSFSSWHYMFFLPPALWHLLFAFQFFNYILDSQSFCCYLFLLLFPFLSPHAFVWWIILLKLLRHHFFSDSVLWENSLLLLNDYFFCLHCCTFKFAAVSQVALRFICLTFHFTSSCPLLFPLSPFNLF